MEAFQGASLRINSKKRSSLLTSPNSSSHSPRNDSNEGLDGDALLLQTLLDFFRLLEVVLDARQQFLSYGKDITIRGF